MQNMDKLRLHLIIGVFVLITLILAIARVTDSGTPSSRTNSWGIAVVRPQVKASLTA